MKTAAGVAEMTSRLATLLEIIMSTCAACAEVHGKVSESHHDGTGLHSARHADAPESWLQLRNAWTGAELPAAPSWLRCPLAWLRWSWTHLL